VVHRRVAGTDAAFLFGNERSDLNAVGANDLAIENESSKS